MKYFKECMVDEREEYMTARDIGLKYGIALNGRLGPGPKVAALLKKYIEENVDDYNETYCYKNGSLSLIYPKYIYEGMLKLLDDYGDNKFKYEVLVSYNRNTIPVVRCHALIKIVARSKSEVKHIVKTNNIKSMLDNIEEDYIDGSLCFVSILSKEKVN